MREDFLHYLWKLKKFDTTKLFTTQGHQVSIISVGQHNLNSGPDFFNAQIRIAEQLWAGNVEIHIQSSDWYAHHHERDQNYDNVILHVVWRHDMEVFRKDNSPIPTLELSHYTQPYTLNRYHRLFNVKRHWINCENEFAEVDNFTVSNWLERLYFERLERKSDEVYRLLHRSKNNWEAVLFQMLAKNFGLKVNADSFLSMSRSFDFSILRKVQSQIVQIEALFFGQVGLLDTQDEGLYYNLLQKEYMYLVKKYKLDNAAVVRPSFFRLRPNNFPTIRLSQLANLYHLHQNLFSRLIAADSIEDVRGLLHVGPTKFWTTHYTFSKTSKASKKIMASSFMDLLIINTLLPLKFSYLKQTSRADQDAILNLIQHIKPERNSTVEKFNTLKKVSVNAMNSQALIQLKTQYCDKHKCLKCAIGNKLLAP